VTVETQISECGTIILIILKQEDEDTIKIEVDIDECRELMLMLNETIIKAGVMSEFFAGKFKSKN
jgi:hypothetical protein